MKAQTKNKSKGTKPFLPEGYNPPEARLYGEGYEPNLRFIEIMKLLKTEPRVLSNIMKVHIGTVNSFIAELKPKKLTFDFAKKLESTIPFLNLDYLMHGGNDNAPFIREPDKEELEKFAVSKKKKGEAKSKIDIRMCERIAAIRALENETQHSFSERLGIERYRIGSIEGKRQNPTIDIIIALRNVYRIDPWWIMTGQGQMSKIDPETGKNKIYLDPQKVTAQTADQSNEVMKLQAKIETLEALITKIVPSGAK